MLYSDAEKQYDGPIPPAVLREINRERDAQAPKTTPSCCDVLTDIIGMREASIADLTKDLDALLLLRVGQTITYAGGFALASAAYLHDMHHRLNYKLRVLRGEMQEARNALASAGGDVPAVHPEIRV